MMPRKWMAALLGLPLAFVPLTCSADDPPQNPDVAAASPRVRLRLSGGMEGHLEPCGCASGQLGGLPRRVFANKRDHDHDLLIEGGNVVAGGTPLDAQKFATAMMVLSMPNAGYDVLGIGPDDLALPEDELTQYLDVFQVPAVASDLVAAADAPWPPAPFLERDAGEAKVRVASFALSVPEQGAGTMLTLLPPAEAWKRAMAGVVDDTYRLVLAHGTVEQIRAMAALEPRPDLIVGITDEIAEPPAAFEPVDGIPVVYPGTRGRMLLDVTLTRQNGQPRITRYAIVPLRGSETVAGALQDKDTVDMLLAHRHTVADMDILEQMAERLPTVNDAEYVGSQVCADCHEDDYAIWQKTQHAHAWQTLEEAEDGERYGWPVTEYPDCVKCHTVGYGYESGFVNPERTPQLENVGCEQCHGAGSAHVDSGGEVELGHVGVARCLQCHDFEQSPDFAEHYKERWEKIRHGY